MKETQKTVKISDYYFEEINAGTAWVIFDVYCTYCDSEKHIKTIDCWNMEVKIECECGNKFLVILEC